MALVQFGAGVVQMSGSIGGTTFARGPSGNYARARTVGVNPATAPQEKIRAVMAYLTDRWLETVTPAQRASWGDYALAVAMKNRLGQSIKLNAMNHYLRSNSVLLYGDKTVIDAAPTILALPDQDPTLSFSVSEATQLMTIVFDDTAGWAGEDDGFLFVRMGRPQNPTRTFFAGPHIYAGALDGEAAPISSPLTLAVPTPVVEGHRLWIAARIARADGRVSEIMSAGPTDVAA